MRNALIEEAHELFVDEIGPEKTLFRACGLGGVPNCGERVPRNGDDKKDQSAREGMKLPDFLQATGEKQIRQHYSHGKNQADQTFGQNVEGNRYGNPPAQPERRFRLLTCDEKKIQSQGEEDCD